VATVLANEDGGEGGQDLSPFAGLYLSPVAGAPSKPPGEPAAAAESVPDGAFTQAEADYWPDRGLALAGVAAAVVLGGGSVERRRRRRSLEREAARPSRATP
jgi:hypothetical protein